MKPQRIFLVHDDNWDWLLIGRETLAKCGALPEQTLWAKATPEPLAAKRKFSEAVQTTGTQLNKDAVEFIPSSVKATIGSGETEAKMKESGSQTEASSFDSVNYDMETIDTAMKTEARSRKEALATAATEKLSANERLWWHEATSYETETNCSRRITT